MAGSGQSRGWRIGVVAVMALALSAAVFAAYSRRVPESISIPYFSTVPERGAVRPALPYRIVSFHRGRADKSLIKLASQLDFNGVQFQIEGSNEEGIKDFASRDAKEHLIDYCHSLGMEVTVWVHELSDLPPRYLRGWKENPDYLGEPAVDNQRMWEMLDKRYEWILSKAIPKADGLVLTVVETQVNATQTPIMQKLVELIDKKCREHGKYLIVRTFVWRPDELEGVMGAVKQMPGDIKIMSKAVPQDWQLRAPPAAEIGAVGDRPQIVEYDVEGEYFLRNAVANCMVDLLKKQFDYGLTKGVKGICVRVDRQNPLLAPDKPSDNVLFVPQEMNLWTLGMLASGATGNTEEIWRRWAEYRYGEAAAPAVIAALKPSAEVVAEMLSIGPFTHGDTRAYPAQPDQDVLGQNWQPWRWDERFVPVLKKAYEGAPDFVEELAREKAAALKTAESSLAELANARGNLSEREYKILHTKLLTNRMQLEFRSAAVMAAMHYRQMRNANTREAGLAALERFKKDLADVERVEEALKAMAPPEKFDYLGRTWSVGYPEALFPEQVHDWRVTAEKLLPQ